MNYNFFKWAVLCLYFISLLEIIVSAQTLYAGENTTITLDYKIINCTSESNLNLSWQEKDLLIQVSQDYVPGNTEILCYVQKNGDVISYQLLGGGSGGVSCKYDENFDWNCSEWSNCINGEQERACNKYNNCYNTYGKPVETRLCSVITEGDYSDFTEEETESCELGEECIEDTAGNEKDKSNKLEIILSVILVVFILLILDLISKLRRRHRKD